MKGIAVIIFFLFIITSGSGQTIVFKGQVLCNDLPVKNYTLLVAGNTVTTNFEGYFTAVLAASATTVKIQQRDKQYIIVYPWKGDGVVPKDPGAVIPVIVEPFKANKYLQSYLSEVKKLKVRSDNGNAGILAMQTKIDSIARTLAKFNYTSQDLAQARERQDGRDLFYPEISGTLQEYINQARNLAAAFQYTAAFAFDNHNALEALVQAVNNYNPAYNKLYDNYNTYAQKIKNYWQSDTLKQAFDSIADTLITGIHRNTIFPLNDLKNSINKYFLGQVNARDKPALKDSIQSRIAAIVPALNIRIAATEQRIQDFQNQLKNSTLNNNTR